MDVDDNASAVLPDGRAQHTGYGPKPDMVTATQWQALQRLHEKLAHPSTSSLVRMLRRWKAQPNVLEAVALLRCAVCAELRRPNRSRQGIMKAAQYFNHIVGFDEFEVVLSDSHRQMLLMIIDEASSYAVVVPLESTRMPKFTEIEQMLARHWFTWAGVPTNLRFDPAGAHTSERMKEFCDQVGTTPLVSPAEAHNRTARGETHRLLQGPLLPCQPRRLLDRAGRPLDMVFQNFLGAERPPTHRRRKPESIRAWT